MRLIGVDVGGTFTDIVFTDTARGAATGHGASSADGKDNLPNPDWHAPMVVCRVPYDRDPERVLDGLISVETARRDFGVVLTPAMTIDTDATAAARATYPSA